MQIKAAEFAALSQVDVIVMATVQRRGDKRIGGITEHSLHRMPCSKLLVKPAEALSSCRVG